MIVAMKNRSPAMDVERVGLSRVVNHFFDGENRLHQVRVMSNCVINTQTDDKMKESQEESDFGAHLKNLRNSYRDESHKSKGLTLRELGERIGLSFARISDLESGRRYPNEDILRKLAGALNLEGESARDFVLRGLRTGREPRLPKELLGIPPEVLDLLMREIYGISRGKVPKQFRAVDRDSECDLLWQDEDGRWFAMEVVGACGSDPKEAVRNLRRKMKSKAE